MSFAPATNVAVAPDLTHGPATILRAFFLAIPAAGLTTAPATAPWPTWPVWVNFLPDTPDQAIAISDTSGVYRSGGLSDGRVFQVEGVQLRLRSRDPAALRAKADALTRLTDKIIRFPVAIEDSDYVIASCRRKSTLSFMGREADKPRWNITVNYLLEIRAA